MKFSLLKVLLFVTVVALVIVVVVKRDRSLIVQDFFGSESWRLEDSVSATSNWHDKNSAPPLSAENVYAAAKQIARRLESAHKEIGFYNWNIESITLLPLELDSGDKWAYICCLRGDEFPAHLGINNLLDLRFLMLMDGTLMFDPEPYTETLVSIIEETGSVQLTPRTARKSQLETMQNFDSRVEMIQNAFTMKKTTSAENDAELRIPADHFEPTPR